VLQHIALWHIGWLYLASQTVASKMHPKRVPRQAWAPMKALEPIVKSNRQICPSGS
jgi:hypothetical protein